MNTNELIWNAQISQGFLKGKPLTISLQFYDILHNQSNFSRVITAVQKSDTKYNSINSYAMLHVVYRMNVFGGKQGDDPKRRIRPEGMSIGPGARGISHMSLEVDKQIYNILAYIIVENLN